MTGHIRVWITSFTVTTEDGNKKTFDGPYIFAFDYKEAKLEADLIQQLIDNNYEWFKNEGINFYKDQPFLRSKGRIWFIPTIVVLKKRTFFNLKINLNIILSGD